MQNTNNIETENNKKKKKEIRFYWKLSSSTVNMFVSVFNSIPEQKSLSKCSQANKSQQIWIQQTTRNLLLNTIKNINNMFHFQKLVWKFFSFLSFVFFTSLFWNIALTVWDNKYNIVCHTLHTRSVEFVFKTPKSMLITNMSKKLQFSIIISFAYAKLFETFCCQLTYWVSIKKVTEQIIY